MQSTQEKPDYKPINIRLTTKGSAEALLSLMELLWRMGENNRKEFSPVELSVIKELRTSLSHWLEKLSDFSKE